MAIESGRFEINEIVGCDPRQKASTEEIMTFDNVGSCKSADDIVYDAFQKLCNPLHAVDPAHKPDYSCMMYKLDVNAFVIGLIIGLIIGGLVATCVMWGII